MPTITAFRNVIPKPPLPRKSGQHEKAEEYETIPIQIILTYFDTNRGPLVFLADPPKVVAEVEAILVSLMDLDLPEGFFEYNILEKNLTLGNYLFNIPSEWARGEEEIVMITVILQKQQKFSRIKTFLGEIAQILSKTPDLFKGFYNQSSSHKDDPEVDIKYQFLTANIFYASNFITNYLNLIDMGRILVLGNLHSGKSPFLNYLERDPLTSVKQFRTETTLNLSTMASKQFKDFNPILNPGKHILDFFLEQSQFWLYDLDHATIRPEDWLPYIKNPIGIIFMCDLSSSDESHKQAITKFQKVLIHYSSEYSDGCVHPHMPVLILANKKDRLVKESEDYWIDRLKLNSFSFNSQVFLISTQLNEGIDKAIKWFLSQLLLL